mgnify:CR=1 FL=1
MLAAPPALPPPCPGATCPPLPGCRLACLGLASLFGRRAAVRPTVSLPAVQGLIGALGFWPATVLFPIEMYRKIHKPSM